MIAMTRGSLSFSMCMLKVEPKSLQSAGSWSQISSKNIYSDPLYNKPEGKQLQKQSEL